MSASGGVRHIIIAGANKAGTTSLYRYLGDHPAVCTSFVKQSFYFLDEDLQRSLGLRSLRPFDDDPDSYLRFFEAGDPGEVLLDASPEYLYSPGTAARIRGHLRDEVKIVFILRNPVDRLLSLYRYGIQQGLLPPGMDLRSFIAETVDHHTWDNPSLVAFQSGLYSNYLPSYFEAFDPADVIVLFFEELVEHPRRTVQDLAERTGLDAAFYDAYTFDAHNVTVGVRWQGLRQAYLGLRRIGLSAAMRWPAMRRVSQRSRDLLAPLYRLVNVPSRATSPHEADARQTLSDLYRDEVQRVTDLVGRRPPGW